MNVVCILANNNFTQNLKKPTKDLVFGV